MNRSEFLTTVAIRYEQCQQTLGLKGTAYSGQEDVLANFKRNAERLGLSKYQIWGVYFNKHIDAIQNAIKSSNGGIPIDKSEGLGGRITDAINYLLLLDALHEEDINGSKNGSSVQS